MKKMSKKQELELLRHRIAQRLTDEELLEAEQEEDGSPRRRFKSAGIVGIVFIAILIAVALLIGGHALYAIAAVIIGIFAYVSPG